MFSIITVIREQGEHRTGARMASMDSSGAISLLLVEDDRDSCESLTRMLERRGVDVTPVEDAETAARLYDSSDTFDIIVADIRLGGMSGVDLLRHVRSRDLLFPVILLTGYDSMESAIEAVRLGAQNYILKPLDSIEDLLLPVEKAVESRRLLLRNKALEEDLKGSETRLRELFLHMSSGVVVFRKGEGTNKFVVTDLNRAGERIEGATRTSVLGKEIGEAFSASDDFGLREIVQEVHDTGRPESRPVTVLKGGEIIASRMQYAYKLPTDEVVVVFDDVTELRRGEQREDDLRARLARAERIESVGVLAGGVAHDLNNILGSMVVLPDLIEEELLRKNEESDIREVLDDLSMIRSSAKRSVDIVRDLLALSRRGKYRLEPINISDVINECLGSAVFRDACDRHKNVTTNRDLDPRSLSIIGSESHLIRVFTNLLINAFESMPDGGTLSIALSRVKVEHDLVVYEVVEEGEYAVVSVRDTGEGISEDHLGRIFEPFYTSKQASSRSGTGLGLAIVHGIVKDHGGFIDVRSTVGTGTEFLLYFPIVHDEISGAGEATRD